MNESKPRGVETEASDQEELRRTISEYDARLAAVAALAGRVRHEINNPLTGLIGQAQLLQREPLSETARRRVQTIERLAARIRDAAAELRQAERVGEADKAVTQETERDRARER